MFELTTAVCVVVIVVDASMFEEATAAAAASELLAAVNAAAVANCWLWFCLRVSNRPSFKDLSLKYEINYLIGHFVEILANLRAK